MRCCCCGGGDDEEPPAGACIGDVGGGCAKRDIVRRDYLKAWRGVVG